MTKLKVLCWQEIPSLVEATDSEGTHKVQLGPRFQELIDLVAMKRGLGESDAYLMEWRKESRPSTDRPARAAAEEAAAEIEAKYDEIKAEALAKS